MNRLDLLILAANPVGRSPVESVRELGPVEILAAPSTDPLQLDFEISQVQSCLEAGRYRERITVDYQLAVGPHRLMRLLRESKANVFHFSGHSTERGIVLADERNNAPVLVHGGAGPSHRGDGLEGRAVDPQQLHQHGDRPRPGGGVRLCDRDAGQDRRPGGLDILAGVLRGHGPRRIGPAGR
jgi:hypothetical protein